MKDKSPGYGAFRAGALGLVFFGAFHLLAVYHALAVEPATEAEIEVKRAALAHAMKIGPFNATAFGCIQILNSSYSVLLIYAGVLNLILMRPLHDQGLLRRAATVNILFVGLLAAITLAFQFPPPLLIAGVVLVLFVVARFRLSATPHARDSLGHTT